MMRSSFDQRIRSSTEDSKMTIRTQNSSAKSAPKSARKMRWLAGGSMAAAAFLLASAPQTAQAQSQTIGSRIDAGRAFQANIDSVSAPVIIQRGASADIYTLGSAQTVINWSPQDTANSDDLINILPSVVSPSVAVLPACWAIPVGRSVATSGSTAPAVSSWAGTHVSMWAAFC